jgi:heat shock protein HslJ
MNSNLRRLAAGLALTVPALAGAQAPTWQEAADAEYGGIYDDPVRLSGGVYEGEPFVAGGASRPRVVLIPDFIRQGDLDGDGLDETVVLISESSGGSGTFDYLAILDRQDGAVRALPAAPLGDRVRLMSAEIRAGRLELRVVQAGEGDPACCPGEVADRSLALQDGALVEVSRTPLHRLSPADLAGREWRLWRINGEPPPVGDHVPTLTVADAAVSGLGGCNRYSGTLTPGEGVGEIEIGRLASTRRACPEPWMSLEQRYLTVLGQAARFGFRAGRLVITHRDGPDAGTLTFD